MKKLNKKGIVFHGALIYAAVAVTAAGVHLTKYNNGQWGRCGTDNFQSRQSRQDKINQAPGSERNTFDYSDYDTYCQ